MKILFRNIHLYLSLAAGLVIMIACFTGAVLVFEEELQHTFHKDRYFVKPEAKQLPLEQLLANVQEQVPGSRVAGVKVYADAARSVEISLFMPEGGAREKAGAAETAKNQTEKAGEEPAKAEKPKKRGRPSHTAFVNPYSGEMLELYSYRETFFYQMFALHRWLLGGPNSIGKIIVGVATIFFLFILITGIVLWWPKNGKILKQRLKVKWDGSWKRLNHDFHIVLGFYTAIFLFIFAFTGLAWSFDWFNKGIYAVTNSEMKSPEPPTSAFKPATAAVSLDDVYQKATSEISNVKYYSFRSPADSAGIFTVNVLPNGAHETASDNYYIDQYSGEIIGSLKFSDKNLGQRVRSTFKPVHLSSIYGIPSKIVGFIVCLLGVTFPVTGVILWLNRLKKEKKKNSRIRVMS